MKIRLLKVISIFSGVLLILQLCEPLIIKFLIHNLTDNSVVIRNAEKDAAAIGIIGGADGPMAIFLSGVHFIPREVSLVVCLIMTVVPAIIVWRDTKKAK